MPQRHLVDAELVQRQAERGRADIVDGSGRVKTAACGWPIWPFTVQPVSGWPSRASLAGWPFSA